MFVGALPLQCVIRVFDCYLNEGFKIMYRMALGILKIAKNVILNSVTNDAVESIINTVATKCTADDLFKVAFKLSLKRAKFAKIAKSIKVDNNVTADEAIFYTPQLQQPSAILTEELISVLWSFLPSRYRIQDPIKLYASDKHGFSLRTLYSRVEEKEPPTLLVIKSAKDDIFGAFISAPWSVWRESTKNGKAQFYGNGQTFLFSLHPIPKDYTWTKKNNLFFSPTPSGVEIGAGGSAGLAFDSDLLQGISGKCETFNNDPLTTDPSGFFKIRQIEVYAFENK